MKISILNKQDYSTGVWSGGSTTQLFISPANASYTKRNFELRLSSAKVEVDSSEFTTLPGIYRKLMILDGEITINHEDQYSKHLKQYDVDSFKGDWSTTSVGKCTDFNVMTKGAVKSELSYIEIHADSLKQIKLDENWKTIFIYVLTGSLSIEINSESQSLDKESLLVAENLEVLEISLRSDEGSRIAVGMVG